MNISRNYHEHLFKANNFYLKLALLLVSLLFFVLLSHASTSKYSNTPLATASYNGYGNSYIFVENGIEFSVFPDGQFDFNILGNNSNLSLAIGTPNANISFNTGYNYNNYVQYDEFGAIIQIENNPIYYDNYGRIIQAGNVNIYYNNVGYVSRVGGLYVHYNQYNRFAYCTGYINIYNRAYVYRPWHRYYAVPTYQYCVVYNRPYRRHYYPVRYNYYRPFYNNYRPNTAVGRRQGNTIYRNSRYATANRSSRNRTTINRSVNSRNSVAHNNNNRNYYSKGRSSKTNRTYTSMNRNNKSKNAYKNSSSVNNLNKRTKSKTVTPNRSNSDFYRNKSTMVSNSGKGTSLKRATSSKYSKTNNTIAKNDIKRTSHVYRKPNNSKSRKYNKTHKSTRNTQVTKRNTSTSRVAQQNKTTGYKQNSIRNSKKGNIKSSSRRRV